jgi:hypothetical protein
MRVSVQVVCFLRVSDENLCFSHPSFFRLRTENATVSPSEDGKIYFVTCNKAWPNIHHSYTNFCCSYTCNIAYLCVYVCTYVRMHSRTCVCVCVRTYVFLHAYEILPVIIWYFCIELRLLDYNCPLLLSE